MQTQYLLSNNYLNLSVDEIFDSIERDTERSDNRIKEEKDWDLILASSKKSSMIAQYDRVLFERRCKEAKSLGFTEIVFSDILYEWMGQKHNAYRETGERMNLNWMYNHHTGEMLSDSRCDWGGIDQDFIYIRFFNKIPRILRFVTRLIVPFIFKEKWKIRNGHFQNLKRDIPHDILVKMAKIKDLKLFNYMKVIAPIDAFKENDNKVPIIVYATIATLPRKHFNDSPSSSGKPAHFFIGEWIA